MGKQSTNHIPLSKEEIANTWTHAIPFFATLLIAWPLMRLACEAQSAVPGFQVLGTALFLFGSLLMYGSSTLYHLVTEPVHKRRLRVFDHISIFAMIAGGQQAAVNGKKDSLNALSSKIKSYSDLDNFLTIKDQLGNLSTIASNKKLLSRTFGILSALMPKNSDTIKFLLIKKYYEI